MTRSESQHLDEAEVDLLLAQSAPEAKLLGNELPEELESARAHVDNCKECEQKLTMYRAVKNVLKSLQGGKFPSPTGECVDETLWPAVVGGVFSDESSLNTKDMLPPDLCLEYLAHAASCQSCGSALKEAVADFNEKPTPEEEAILSGMEERSRSWATPPGLNVVAPTVHETQLKPSFNLLRALFEPTVLIPAIASVMIVTSMGLYLSFSGKPEPSIESLLAQAYSEDRTFEFRIPGGRPSPVRQQRGQEKSLLEEPQSLLLATRAIQEGRSKRPNDPLLLDAKGRVELLMGDTANAVKSLEMALETDANSEVIMTDMATAYLLRGRATGSQKDVAAAEDLLSKILQRNPGNNTARFNRALLEENAFLYDDATKDWQVFVKTEMDPEWRAAGQAHLDALQHRTSMSGRPKSEGEHTPQQALAELQARRKDVPETESDALRDEEFVDDALRHWLPSLAGFSDSSQGSIQKNSLGSREALAKLSDMLRKRHHDDFLADLMSGEHSPLWQNAIGELGAAVRANAQGDMPEIVAHARRSAVLFREADNNAGEAIAAFEFLSGKNRLQVADPCLAIAASGLRISGMHRYPWVESSFLFESATCDFSVGKQQAALETARRARDVAKRANYKILALQGDYFLDGVTTPWIATADSWNRISVSLKEFWRLPYPVFIGEGLYTDLGYAAQSEGLWHCAEAVFQESVAIHSMDEDRATQAAAHHLLAKAAEASGDESLAEAEYGRAADSLANVGKNSEQLRTLFEIERATIEVKQNRVADAARTLEEITPHISDVRGNYQLFPYFSALGQLHLRNGDLMSAEKELNTAITLIEKNKQTQLSQSDLLAWNNETSSTYRSLLELYLADHREPVGTLSLLEWYRAGPLKTEELVHPNSPLEAVHLLPYRLDRFASDGKRGLLTWISFPHKLAIFYADKDGVHSVTTAIDRNQIELAARKFRRLCADPSSDAEVLDRSARQLYDWLVQPIESHFSHENTLIVEPDEGFQSLPFEVLKNSKGRYLGEIFQIIESPGVGYTQLLRVDKQISRESIVLVVGDPLQGVENEVASTPRFRPLPDAFREASNVAAGFSRSHLLTGKSATRERVLKLLPDAEVFHFAGHALSGRGETGLAFASTPSSGEILLMDPSQLKETLLKKLKLVILSGCETGLSDQGMVDPESLVRVFLHARVPNVVASKWRVDSKSSADLMTAVYQRLLGGEPIEQALAASQRQLRNNPQTAHPYYWASFAVFGR